VWVSIVLALNTSFDCCCVSKNVRMWSAFSVFMIVVFEDSGAGPRLLVGGCCVRKVAVVVH